MRINPKDTVTRLYDARSSRNSLSQLAARCSSAVKEFGGELPHLEAELDHLRVALAAKKFKPQTGTSPNDELASFAGKARQWLEQFDEVGELIAQLRPRIESLGRGGE